MLVSGIEGGLGLKEKKKSIGLRLTVPLCGQHTHTVWEIAGVQPSLPLNAIHRVPFNKAFNP